MATVSPILNNSILAQCRQVVAHFITFLLVGQDVWQFIAYQLHEIGLCTFRELFKVFDNQLLVLSEKRRNHGAFLLV
jgi:hypothetical protein